MYIYYQLVADFLPIDYICCLVGMLCCTVLCIHSTLGQANSQDTHQLLKNKLTSKHNPCRPRPKSCRPRRFICIHIYIYGNKQNKNHRLYRTCRNLGKNGERQWPDMVHKNLKDIADPSASDVVKNKFKEGNLPRDEDKPGEGQFYCVCCDKYFMDAKAREVHFKTKGHKKTLKESWKEPHTQKDAEEAGKF